MVLPLRLVNIIEEIVHFIGIFILSPSSTIAWFTISSLVLLNSTANQVDPHPLPVAGFLGQDLSHGLCH
jgi:hypothetical protein